MRSLDLMGATVADEDGRHLGTVHDLLLESGAPPLDDSSEPALAISKLVVGPVGIGHRLGYGRGAMAGPWPLTVLLRWLGRDSFDIPWSDVVQVASRTVTVRRGVTPGTDEKEDS
ncbi:MAG TPA: hypothetical protein VG502_05580 [Flexivirga sp.]|uniref:hypothetical protein n=1 Tax=Flexivirga sp. TaxID=1962927 RepID=UPI002CDAFF82|nr:hypothetical protein [Flexivirga sp.]HWC21750.1 hypothetical protein [Flexivirga sp.]